ADLGVLKSIDGGANWASTGLSGVIETLAIDPGTPSRLYSVVAGMGAFKSEDGGEHWSLINPTRSDGTTDLVRALAIDFTPPECPPCIYAGGSDGVYKSTNGGTTWAIAGLSGHAVSALASYASALYATTQDGIFKSVGGGEWTAAEIVPSAMDPQ